VSTSVKPETPSAGADFPVQPLLHLDALWFQVAGTICNLTCTHCFVSCGPGNHRHGFLTRTQVRDHLAQGLSLGVREVYFTGGEPFLHPDLTSILEDTLAHAPATVLTNGTLFTEARARRLAELAAGSRHSLELRVSLDGASAAEHDRFRGAGAFARTLDGLRRLERHGLLPIVTATLHAGEAAEAAAARHLAALRAAGIARPRLKLLPYFQLGRGAESGEAAATLAGLPSESFDAARLPCARCRAITSRGVHVCPLLVDETGGRMGDRLGEALGPFTLSHSACLTCWVSGMTCAND
jgi:MoaA/NifB/PqqE/SkfB family radical SAM enzyme